MATISLTSIADGALAIAADLRNNYNAIASAINGGLDNTNVSSSAAVAYSKLNLAGSIVNADVNSAAAVAVSKLAPGTNGQALLTTGGVTAWGAPGGLTTYRKTTAKTVNTTVAATDLLNGEITVAAGAMGSTGVARLSAFGDWKQNSGGTTNAYRFQLLFGGTTIFDTGAPAFVVPNLATRFSWRLNATIMNTAAAAQVASFDLLILGESVSAVAATLTTGEGVYASGGNGVALSHFNGAQGYNSSAVNTASAQALVLNVINPSASAGCELVLAGALVEVA